MRTVFSEIPKSSPTSRLLLPLASSCSTSSSLFVNSAPGILRAGVLRQVGQGSGRQSPMHILAAFVIAQHQNAEAGQFLMEELDGVKARQTGQPQIHDDDIRLVAAAQFESGATLSALGHDLHVVPRVDDGSKLPAGHYRSEAPAAMELDCRSTVRAG